MTDRRHREDYKLAVADWPATDAAAWHRACHPTPGPFSANPSRSPYTYRKYANGYGIYLWYLKCQGLLDPAERLADRVTIQRLGGFFAMLQQRGNADYTIVGRFDELRGAMRLMLPEEDFAFITRPQNISIRQRLHMERAVRFVPDFRHAVLWADTLFREALDLADPLHRQLQVRDAALIGILTSRGPRQRTVTGMRLGRHLIRVGDTWELFFDKTLMKGERTELALTNDPRINAILERYVAVERQELLGDQTHDFVWVTRHGGPLSYKGIETMVKIRTKAQYGISFGPHRFRSSLITTAAMIDGTNSLSRRWSSGTRRRPL